MDTIVIPRYAMNENSLVLESEDRIFDSGNLYNNIDTYFREIINLDKRHRVYAYCVAYNSQKRILGVLQLAGGLIDSVTVDSNTQRRFSINLNCYSWVCIHNHPMRSGVLSDGDIESYQEEYEYFSSLGFEVSLMAMGIDFSEYIIGSYRHRIL